MHAFNIFLSLFMGLSFHGVSIVLGGTLPAGFASTQAIERDGTNTVSPFTPIIVPDRHSGNSFSASIGGNITSLAENDQNAFTCFGTTDVDPADCQKAIDKFKAYSRDLYITAGYCVGIPHGKCSAEICAKSKGPVQVSAGWVAGLLETPLQTSCIVNGHNGVFSDCTDIMGECGSWRIWLEEHDS